MRFDHGPLVLCLSLGTAACMVPYGPARVRGSFDRTFDVSGAGLVVVDVNSNSGAIEVRGGELNQVTVKATVTVRDAYFQKRRSDDIARAVERNPPIERVGDTIRIVPLADPWTGSRVSIDYEIVVPARTRLQSATGSGDIRIAGVAGPLDLHSGSGAIDISGARADVRAHTGSGDLRLVDARDGRFELTTGSGAIHADGVKGALEAHAGSGEITVDGEPVERWQMDTGSGAIHARLPTAVGFDLAAHTGSGDIRVAQAHSDGGHDAHEVRVRVGAGGPQLDLRTGSGDIRVE
jgi:Putative adhesin